MIRSPVVAAWLDIFATNKAAAECLKDLKMLFEEEKKVYKKSARPKPPADHVLKYELGFLFNFVSAKSTRFDLEPVLIYELNGITEYRRISLQVEKGLAFLHTLEERFYED